MANQLHRVVLDKQRKTAVVIDVAIPSTKQHQEDGTREAWEMPKPERGAKEGVQGEGSGGPRGKRATRGSEWLQQIPGDRQTDR